MANMIPCNFAATLAAYERSQIDADHAADAREAEEVSLLRGECNPNTPANFAEALHETFASATGEAHARAILDLSRNAPELVAAYLDGLSKGYWESIAAWKAGKAH
ncbi:hypothetical protein [Uliginosibacterium sp. 31-12]|uniref:hypothetical protein n=1 Tax=Uliginosibacterium sp. 31-12 TaxID=3062781 RepID=UPI0026E3774F|nr:hypothetical protein [Uliginosibacterium sp. 31-12]MDO6385615.1 hypothetical protein [Uliginosibacterium sp. 31-12]